MTQRTEKTTDQPAQSTVRVKTLRVLTLRTTTPAPRDLPPAA